MKEDIAAGSGDPGRGGHRGKVSHPQSETAGVNAPGYKLDVAAIARLARLELTPEETALFQTQLGQVLARAARLRALQLDDVEAAAHAFPIFDVLRADESRPGFTPEEALRNAPRAADGLFIVAKVIE